jgi:16S rRNA (guanine1516-N2)-methyltransferase
MKFVITTPQSVDSVSAIMAQFIDACQLEYIPRSRGSLNKVRTEHRADGVIVWETTGPVLYIDDHKLFFHPSMAKCRIAAYRRKKQEDIMIKACQLESGDSFLDCTLGMGADAIVAAYFTGNGKVTGLESENLIAQVMSWGMKMYEGQMPWLNQAIQRIEIINSDHNIYLRQQADNSYDIVYFDPMFSQPILHSQPISPLRRLANNNHLEGNVIQAACRVAKKRVVLKTQAADSEIERLGFTKVMGSKHNPIIYGVIDVR